MGGYGDDYDYDTSDSVVRKSAKTYNIDYDRAYQQGDTGLPPPKDKILLTKAKFPLVVATDVTGSMSTWPKLIFEKLCILYNEILFFLPEELKDSFEISFSAIGDANSDRFPIQVTDFAKGFELDQNIKSLYPEGGGGGQTRETYELVAYYYANCCEIPEALSSPMRPMFFFIGDEGYYNTVNRVYIEDLIGNPPSRSLNTTTVINKLKKRFDVYILRVEYSSKSSETRIHGDWIKVLGKERVIKLIDPRRVVDVILGLVATNVNRLDTFKERLEIRQTPKQVEQVYAMLGEFKAISPELIDEYENETGKKAIWKGRATKGFREFMKAKQPAKTKSEKDLYKIYEKEYPGKKAVWHGKATKDFLKWKKENYGK